MTVRPNLRVVQQEQNAVTLEEEIQLALIQHRQALQHVKWAEEALLPLRQEYARRRGEFMLPTIERLRREFLS